MEFVAKAKHQTTLPNRCRLLNRDKVSAIIVLSLSNMDSWIGRTAHIKLLDCPAFLQMLTYRYDEFLS